MGFKPTTFRLRMRRFMFAANFIPFRQLSLSLVFIILTIDILSKLFQTISQGFRFLGGHLGGQ